MAAMITAVAIGEPPTQLCICATIPSGTISAPKAKPMVSVALIRAIAAGRPSLP
jgi:hypothetical protein